MARAPGHHPAPPDTAAACAAFYRAVAPLVCSTMGGLVRGICRVPLGEARGGGRCCAAMAGGDASRHRSGYRCHWPVAWKFAVTVAASVYQSTLPSASKGSPSAFTAAVVAVVAVLTTLLATVLTVDVALPPSGT